MTTESQSDFTNRRPRGHSLRSAWREWRLLPLYDRFEQIVVTVLTGVMAAIVIAALWNLIVNVFATLVLTGSFDPTDHLVFQNVFGMILTVIIALEFKRSILVVAERRFGIVQVRAVILIGMLAIVRKLIILDLGEIQALQLSALAGAALALGIVYWLVRDQDRKEREAMTDTQDGARAELSSAESGL